MSFILDALKKSESARQRTNRPDSAQIPTGSGKQRMSRWLIFVGALLIINVLVLLVVLLKPAQTSSETVVTTTANEAEATPDEPESFREPEISADRYQPPVIPERNRVQATQNSPVADTLAVETKSADVVEPDPAPVTVQVSAPSHYKTFNEVRVNGSVQLPELHLDIHVYSETPGDRFVFINMSKYKENATLSEGPLVIEIVTEGVILDYRGTRFLLPRE